MNIPSNIYKFWDYRAFLKDRYGQLKETDPTFSFRSFSKDAGFGSPNYLKLVMDGKRNLSEGAIEKFARGVRLDNHESEYFKYMVAHNQCVDTSRQKIFEAKLLYLKELFNVKDVMPELYDYYHDWYHSAILEMVKHSKIKNDPASVANQLVPAITEVESARSIALLKRLNFVQETDEGVLQETAQAPGPSDVEGAAQKIYQEQMAELGAQSIYTQPEGPRGFECVTVSLSPEKVQELKGKIGDLVKELQDQSWSGENDSIFQFNIQLFALTKKEEEETSQPGAGEAA